MNALRRIGAVIAGLAGAFLVVMAAEALTHRMFPPPPGTNMQDMAQVKTYVASLPLTAYAVVLLGWTVGTLIATSVSTCIARTPVTGYIVGAILLAAGVMNAITIPQPLWFSIASFVIFIAMTVVGTTLARPRVGVVRNGDIPAGI
jgi:hypothetical protein